MLSGTLSLSFITLFVAVLAAISAAVMCAMDEPAWPQSLDDDASSASLPLARVDDDGDTVLDAIDRRQERLAHHSRTVWLSPTAPRALFAAALARHRVLQRCQPILDLARVDDDGDVDVREASFPLSDCHEQDEGRRRQTD
jgi:hypothetical protein